jgi:hypothetical protein
MIINEQAMDQKKIRKRAQELAAGVLPLSNAARLLEEDTGYPQDRGEGMIARMRIECAEQARQKEAAKMDKNLPPGIGEWLRDC